MPKSLTMHIFQTVLFLPFLARTSCNVDQTFLYADNQVWLNKNRISFPVSSPSYTFSLILTPLYILLSMFLLLIIYLRHFISFILYHSLHSSDRCMWQRGCSEDYGKEN